MLDQETVRERLLDAAAELFYARGVQSVGMDAVRDAAGVPLKRLYKLYPSKDALVVAVLSRRDEQWRQDLADHVEARTTPEERIDAVFDWLHEWFSKPDYRGCAFINSFGELGAASPGVADQAQQHKKAVQDYLADLASDAGMPSQLAYQLAILAEGAIVTAAISGNPDAARQAKSAARQLIHAAR